MTELSEKQKKIMAALKDKGAILPCPRCGKQDFTLLDDYTTLAIQKNFDNIVIGGPSIPSAVVICSNCGYISLHAIGALGLLEKGKIKGDAENEHSDSHN